MIKIPFKISARTAKLIGRENFSNPEGAIIELVKNSYDADAKKCFVIFDIIFDSVPEAISIKDFKEYSRHNSIFKTSYRLNGKIYSLNQALSQNEIDNLRNFFFTNNSIYIIDNGHGMTKTVVENQWMEIGTGDKEQDYISMDGRIKTGAKGIGRFALDRLGFLSEMWTLPQGKLKAGTYWKMDWKQFDIANKRLNDIEAEIEEQQLDLKQFIKQNLKTKSRVSNKIDETSFSNGTIIKISNLKDNWLESNQENVFKSLEALIPPKELSIPFSVNFYSLQNLKLFGEVETAFFNDYDYKVEAEFDSKKSIITFSITRNELDLKEVKSKFSRLFENSKYPYDLKTLTNKTFKISKTIFELLKWEKDSSNSALLKNIGDFSFSFYFLKNTIQKDYPYKIFSSAERQKVLKKFGGVKIYRDSFRVRPYGDVGNDWLKLGERAAQSPAGAGQRIGDWRVGPNQIAGLVKISRIENQNLIDKSDRGALIENDSFNILKKIITEVVNEFEIDRSIILNKFFIDTKEKEQIARKAEIRIEAEKLADKIVEERVKVETKIYGSKSDLFTETKQKQEKQSYQKIIEEGFQKIEKSEENDAEIAQIRTLASLGIIVSSFAHELKDIRNNLDELEKLEVIYQELVPEENKKKINFKDGTDIIELLKKDNQKISHWVNYSLTAIKKDKRKRTNLNFDKYFSDLSRVWKYALLDSHIKLVFKNSISVPYTFRSFEMDMDTIFNNLISNSIDSLNKLKVIRDRNIMINCSLVKNNIRLTYNDNGIGLSKIFQKNKEEIFLPFVTSKKDKDNNDIGTGLGMYLVKNVVEDNNGSIQIVDTAIGFKIQIEFPNRKK